MLQSLARKLLQFRTVILVGVILLTGFWFFLAKQIKLYDDPNKWPPKDDPNVLLNETIQGEFGGANVVTIQLSVKNGDIFNLETLAKIKRIHENLLLIKGVVREYETSLASLKVKYMKGSEDFYDVTPLMSDAPQNQEEIERIKYGVYHNPTIYGSLVSLDGKSTIFLADFRTGEKDILTDTGKLLPRTDPVTIYKEVQKIIEQETDSNTSVVMAGSPIIIGWVNSEIASYILLAFSFFLFVMVLILWFAFRRVMGIILPLAVGIVASIWAFGIYVFLEGNILRSSSAFIAPFIIVASAACHSVIFLRRFFDEEYPSTKEPILSIQVTISALLIPMLLSLATDAGAFLVLIFVPFQNVSVLGSCTFIGLISIVVCFFFLGMPLLSFFPGEPAVHISEKRKLRGAGFLEARIDNIIKAMVIRSRVGWGIIGGLMVVIGLSIFIVVSYVDPGQNNTYAIHNYLTRSWKHNSIYQMEMDIKKKFGAIYPLNILIQVKEEEGLKKPEVIKKIDAFSKYLTDKFPEIPGVMDLPLFIKLMHRFLHSENDQFFGIPEEKRTIGEYLEFYEQGQPGTFDSVMNPDFTKTVLAAYVDSTDPKIVRKILNAAREYADSNFSDDKITVGIAGGAIGIADAFNKNIGKWLVIGTIFSALITFLLVAVLLRSLIAPIFLLIPLFVASIIYLAVMYLTGIEINSNITSSMSVAMGIGIDSEIYFLYRFREEFSRTKEFKSSLVLAFTRILTAVIFSNSALILACWSLIPLPVYLGYVGYSVGMILLICLCVGGIICPFAWGLLRPKFLFPPEGRLKSNPN